MKTKIKFFTYQIMQGIMSAMLFMSNFLSGISAGIGLIGLLGMVIHIILIPFSALISFGGGLVPSIHIAAIGFVSLILLNLIFSVILNALFEISEKLID